MECQDISQNPPKLTLQYQWSSSLHAQMKYAQASQTAGMKPASASAPGATIMGDGCDAPTSQADDATDAGMIFLGGHRTRPNWSPQEDLILLQHVARHGTRNWGSLQTSGMLPLRDQKACCNRFILLKKRCIKDKRSLSHLLQRAKESAVATDAGSQDNQTTANSFATPAFSCQQLPALSASGLGLNNNSRLSFKNTSPSSSSPSAAAAAAAVAAFNSPSASTSPTAVRSPVFLTQQQQQFRQLQQQQQQQLQQAFAGSPVSVPPSFNAFSAASGSGSPSGTPLLQMPSLNSSTPLSMSVQLANLKSRLSLQPGSLLAQALRLMQRSDFSSVADLPLLANVHKLAKSSSSSSLTAAASAPVAGGSPLSGSPSRAFNAAAGGAASEPLYMRRSSLSSTGACPSPTASFSAAGGAYDNGHLAQVARLPSFDVSSVCTGPASASAAAGTPGAGSPSATLPLGTAVGGSGFAGGGGGVEGGGGSASDTLPVGEGSDNAFASVPSSSFTALLTSSSAAATHHLASMAAANPGAAAAAAAAPAAAFSHTWRPQGNARCLQNAIRVEETRIQQQQVAYQFQQHALELQHQQQHQEQEKQQQQQQLKQEQDLQQEQEQPFVPSQRPDLMLEAFSSARSNSHGRNMLQENQIFGQSQPQQMLDACAGDVGDALDFPLSAFDDKKLLGAAEFQNDQLMPSRLADNGIFGDMSASFSEADMLQAIQAEMEMLSSIVNAS